MNYLKISKATDLYGINKIIYRFFEILPGFLSWATLIVLIVLSYFKPIGVAYFIIAFDVYWLLLVFYLGIHLLVSYKRLKENTEINWEERCKKLDYIKINTDSIYNWEDVFNLIILPTYYQMYELIQSSFD